MGRAETLRYENWISRNRFRRTSRRSRRENWLPYRRVDRRWSAKYLVVLACRGSRSEILICNYSRENLLLPGEWRARISQRLQLDPVSRSTRTDNGAISAWIADSFQGCPYERHEDLGWRNLRVPWILPGIVIYKNGCATPSTFTVTSFFLLFFSCFEQIADELGILIWHDMMYACSMYPANEQFLETVSVEIRQQVRRLSHHPSVLIWAGNNENEVALRQNW